MSSLYPAQNTSSAPLLDDGFLLVTGLSTGRRRPMPEEGSISMMALIHKLYLVEHAVIEKTPGEWKAIREE